MPEKAIESVMPEVNSTELLAAPQLVNSENISEPRLVSVDEISTDPTQPRKTFNEQKMNELIASIRQYGILQSLLLRPNPAGGYLLVFGERRLRAARAIGIKEVPYTIRNITDDVAKEMQLIENLQREDVHPMEQAKAFLCLIEDRQIEPMEIANRIGKSIYFVRQHLKLNSLIAKWQKILLKNGISLTTALQICTLPDILQKDLYDNQVTKEDETNDNPSISINTYLLNKYKGDLSNACFDINDAELDKKSGACTSCPFNSALSSLFPHELERPKCSNPICFKNKTDRHYDIELSKAKEDAATMLVFNGHQAPDKVKAIKKEGNEILQMGYGEECREVRPPEKPEWESYVRSKKGGKVSDKKLKEGFKAEEENYLANIGRFEKAVATGKLKKAFVVSSGDSHQVGKYVFVELTPTKNTKPVKKTIDETTDSIEDIDNEIKRIQDREIRAKEIDEEKIQRKISEAVNLDTSVNAIPKKTSQIETALLHFLVLDCLKFSNREEIKKVIKSPDLWSPKDRNKFKTALCALSKEQVAYITRKIVIDKFSNSLPGNDGGFVFRLMAESLGSIPITDFENEQKEIAKKRQANVNKSIAVLKELKKELTQKTRIKAKHNSLDQKPDKKRA